MPNVRTPANIDDLIASLSDVFAAVCSDPKRANQADSAANSAGKIIAALNTKMEYCRIRGEQPEILYMGESGSKLLKSPAKQLAA